MIRACIPGGRLTAGQYLALAPGSGALVLEAAAIPPSLSRPRRLDA